MLLVEGAKDVSDSGVEDTQWGHYIWETVELESITLGESLDVGNEEEEIKGDSGFQKDWLDEGQGCISPDRSEPQGERDQVAQRQLDRRPGEEGRGQGRSPVERRVHMRQRPEVVGTAIGSHWLQIDVWANSKNTKDMGDMFLTVGEASYKHGKGKH